jgi:hypothetical protein
MDRKKGKETEGKYEKPRNEREKERMSQIEHEMYERLCVRGLIV